MVGINSSDSSSFLQRILNKKSNDLNKNLSNLASGKKAALDNAAAEAIAAEIDGELGVRSQANRNIADFQSVAELRDTALDNISNIETRQRELATQAANGTLSDEQRSVLNDEFQQLSQEITRITETTEFNGNKLFSGTELTAQVGTGSTENDRIALEGVDVSNTFSQKSIATRSDALSAIDTLASEQSSVSAIRAKDGAAVSRLEKAANNNETTAEALQVARSRIRSVDVANETAELVKNQIGQQGAASLLTQNLSAQNVLNLLK